MPTREEAIAEARRRGILSPQEEARIDATKRVASTPGVIRSISQGIGFNFVDDIDAYTAAGTTAVNNALGGALFGKKSYSPQQAKAAVLQAEREASAKYAQEHPVMSGVGTVAGAILSPVNKVLGPLSVAKAGAGMGMQMLRAGMGGAAAGALAGAGDQGVDGILPAAALGFGLGGAVPPVFRAASNAVQPLAQAAVNRVPQNVRSAATAGVNAMLGSAAQRAGVPPPPPRANPAEMKVATQLEAAIQNDARAGVQFRPGQSPLYQAGDNLFGLYEAAAAYPGTAQTALRKAAQANQDAAPQAVVDDLGRELGAKGDFFDYQNNLIKTRQANATAGMDDLADQRFTPNQDTVLALRADRTRAALTNSAENMMASVNPAVRAQAADLLQVLDQALDNPAAVSLRIRDAQNISEKLLNAGDRAFRSGDNEAAKTFNELGRAIRTNARDPQQGGIAAYDDWLKQYGSDADNSRALELGRDAVRNLNEKGRPEKVRATLGKMDPAALDHYRKGLAEELLHKVFRSRGDTTLMRELGKKGDQNLQQNIALAFPDDASFAAFVKSAEQRIREAERNNAILSGSATARRQAGMKAMSDPQSDAIAAVDELVGGVASPQSVPGRVARGLGRMLPKQTGVLNDEAANALLGQTALNPDEITRLLNMLQTTRAQSAVQQQQAARAAPAIASTFRF
jgi:hypothetical protein